MGTLTDHSQQMTNELITSSYDTGHLNTSTVELLPSPLHRQTADSTQHHQPVLVSAPDLRLLRLFGQAGPP